MGIKFKALRTVPDIPYAIKIFQLLLLQLGHVDTSRKAQDMVRVNTHSKIY